MKKDQKNIHSDTWCPIPFIAISYHPTGTLTRCMMSEVPMSNNLNWDDRSFQDLRQSMLNGKWDLPGCDSCFKKEQVGITSKRHEWINGPTRERFPLTAYDNPQLTNNTIRHLFLNFNNICNFKCRMCSPKYSNSLIPEWNQYDWYKESEDKNLSKNINNVEQFIEQNKNKLKDVTQIWITGGEPFIGDTLYNVKESLYKYAVPENIFLTITTNGSKVDVQKLQGFDRFKRLHLDVSLDAVGSLFEYMRSNKVFTWEQMDNFLKNDVVSFGNKNKDWFVLSINSSYQLLNATQIKELYTYGYELRSMVNTTEVNQRVLMGPPFFQARHLPEKLKIKANEQINDLLKQPWLNDFDVKCINDCKQMLNSKVEDEMWLRFVHRLTRQDTYRNISLNDYDSDLAELVNNSL